MSTAVIPNHLHGIVWIMAKSPPLDAIWELPIEFGEKSLYTDYSKSDLFCRIRVNSHVVFYEQGGEITQPAHNYKD